MNEVIYLLIATIFIFIGALSAACFIYQVNKDV